MKNLFILLFSFGLLVPAMAQEKLSEVVITATKYKYLSATSSDEVAVPVEILQDKVANFYVKDADFYRDDYDLYHVTFYIPEGKILAAYDGEGNILRTVEKYKNIALPKAVSADILKKYPNWTVSKDIYLVNYHQDKGATKKYKIKLTNGDKTIRIKCDENGIIQ
ncbi:MAG: nicotinate-nucleotide adenylyltransferase [Bacteroidota bacterium]